MLASLAEQIVQQPHLRLVLIAGPSSSGKTTFARRLCTHLQAQEKTTFCLSVDEFYLDRDKTPLDEHGNHDFEVIDALDLPYLNETLSGLIKGRKVPLPKFDFVKGVRVPGHDVQLTPSTIVVVEGIHGLNDRLTSVIDSSQKFRIFIAPLHQMIVDEFTPIHTTDIRLIRRIVRDHQFRGWTAAETIHRWPSVRHGEEHYIYPFQNNAHAVFNSALDYELGVFRARVEPLLAHIPPPDPAYQEAQRILRFVRNFDSFPEELVPDCSILREFLGHSPFHRPGF
jgi:uridine kinase